MVLQAAGPKVTVLYDFGWQTKILQNTALDSELRRFLLRVIITHRHITYV
jgi:hypothetical protein